VVVCLALVAPFLPACRRSNPTGTSAAASSEVPPAPMNGTRQPEPATGVLDLPSLVPKLTPVVVNVTVDSSVRVAPRGFDGPFDFFFGPRGVRPPGEGEGEILHQRAQGSGFIIDGSGRVVTNAHVVQGADTVRVKLQDEREFKATVKGRDPHIDVAVLQIEGARDLPVASLGSSDALRVGESVIAIGNPFGLGQTVTLGIVSAKSRAIGAGPYDDFIQTDAHINPGNSGGPLFNTRGEVVGINTAISAQGSGIGFAIPIDEVKGILAQLYATGHIERGRLGVVVQAIDWPLARALGLDRPRGALIAEVEDGSPARRAGLKERDVIVSIDGRAVDHWQEVPRLIAGRAPGTRVKLEVVRDAKTMTFDVALAQLADTANRNEPSAAAGATDLGVRVEDASEGGALVEQVAPTGPAGSILQRGDVVLEVNRTPVKTAADFDRLVRAAPAKSTLLLRVKRGERTEFVAIERP